MKKVKVKQLTKCLSCKVLMYPNDTAFEIIVEHKQILDPVMSQMVKVKVYKCDRCANEFSDMLEEMMDEK